MVELTKSPEDRREYRFIELENGLKAVLVHDGEADESAAAVDVGVGSMADPDESLGLAHLCEHLSFLGTQKYPDEASYSQFLHAHGGRSNAYTSKTDTVYYFTVRQEHLENALDRFAQFFIAPLFLEDCYERELNAVHHEHEKNRESDAWRVHEVFLRIAESTQHPFCRFSTGHKGTLGGDMATVRSKLLDWHARHYSANIMTLAVAGRESLDQLEQMVRDKFSAVRNHAIKRPVFPGAPYTTIAPHLVRVVPVKDLRQVHLMFPTPDQTTEAMLEVCPWDYLSHLFGHEAQGSILSALKAHGWANELSSGTTIELPDSFGMFSITLSLTEEGLARVDDVVATVFAYARLIESEGIAEWIFNEARDLAELGFRFREKEKPESLVLSLANRAQDNYAPEESVSFIIVSDI